MAESHSWTRIGSTCLFPALCGLILLVLAARATHPAPLRAARLPADDPTTVTVTYTSSVDGAALDYLEYVPTNYNPTIPYPLAVLLPGSGGNAIQYDTTQWHQAADAHGYI